MSKPLSLENRDGSINRRALMATAARLGLGAGLAAPMSLLAQSSAANAFKQAAARTAPLVEPEHFRRDGEAYIRIAAATGYDIHEYPMPRRKTPTRSNPQSATPPYME